MLLPYGTPIFLPQTLHAAGTAGPKKALRSIEIPGLLQCGQMYTGSPLVTANVGAQREQNATRWKEGLGITFSKLTMPTNRSTQ